MTPAGIVREFLLRAARRIRLQRLLEGMVRGLLLLLAATVALTVVSWNAAATASLLLPALAGAIHLALRSWRPGSSLQAATEIDRRAALRDELASSCWFMEQGLSSPWIDLQIRRASETVQRLRLNVLLPLGPPRGAPHLLALILILALLQLSPLPTLAPAARFSVTSEERSLVSSVAEKLRTADTPRARSAIRSLQRLSGGIDSGTLSAPQVSELLEAVKRDLARGDFDSGRLQRGLQRMAGHLSSSPETEAAATALSQMDLEEASRRLRNLASNQARMGRDSRRLQEALEQAGQEQGAEVDSLSRALRSAGDNLGRQNREAAGQSLDRAGASLDRMADRLSAQQREQETAEQLERLRQSLEQRLQPPPAGLAGEPRSREGRRPGRQQRPVPGRDQAQARRGPGQGRSASASQSGHVRSRGEETHSGVRLERERLRGQPREGPTRTRSWEEASPGQSAAREYTQAPLRPSKARPAILKRDPIPWEYRQLVRGYFIEIRTGARRSR